MKFHVIAGVLIALMIQVMAVQAQELTKEEYKEWKSKQKDMEPLEFKKLFEEYNRLQSEKATFNRQSKALKDKITPQQQEIASLTDEVYKLEERYKELEEKCDNNVTQLGQDYTKGVVYKVQVGAFKEKDLSQFSGALGNFGVEEVEGVKKYTIAYFRDYKEAHVFKEYIRAMGVKDAWVVVYQDNERRHINEFVEPANTLENNN
jgi:hypothetical protein